MKTKFKFLATMLIGILLSTNVWGGEQSFSSTDFSSTNKTCTKDVITVALDEVTISSPQIRWSSGKSCVVSSSAGNISQIEVNTNSTNTYIAPMGGTVSSGTWTKNTNTKYYWNGDASSVTLTANGAVRITTIKVTYADAPAYTITAQSNNNTYGTVSLSGKKITASPNTGYTYASPAYTVTSGTATVEQDGNEFTVTPTSDCTIRINFAAKQIATITLMEAGTPVDGPSGKYSGETYTLPSSVTNVCDGKTFVGWSTVDIPVPGDKPTENYYGKGAEVTLEATNTFYAVYAEVTGGSTGAPEGTTLWGENFEHFGTNKPSGAGTGTGTTIYGGASIVYEEGSTSTKAYNDNLAGGTAPELLLTKNNYQWWSIAGIKTGEAKEMTLTYKTNNVDLVNITVDEDDKFEVAQDGTDKTKWTLTVKDGETVDDFTLNFWNTSTGSNIRLDDIVLVVSQAGASYSNYTTCGSKYSVTFKNQESVISTDEYTAGTVIHAPATAENTCGDGFFFVGWLAQPLYVGDTPNPKPDGLIQPNGEITVPAEDVVYYAVFAQKRIN